MFQDVVDVRDFYQTPLGRVTRQLLRTRIRDMWPDVRGQSVLGLGFATPFLQAFRGEAERVLAIMPAGQGVVHWPHDEPNLTALADETELPLQDYSVDRILMVHGLEGSDHPGDMLREAWRVLAGGGRLLLVVPNRRSFWAQSERTPFGFGQPYSSGQLSRLLRNHSFTPLRTERSLCFLPFRARSWLRMAPGWDAFARHAMPGLAGAILIEATKQVYGAIPVKRARRALPAMVRVPAAAATRGLSREKLSE
ncbi:class I SAM-dependent methyltransferase [Dongia rigui]|uniref:Methyltransferase domain-containing protein n=1 Tax=Dongia rigui TaxID=940149 RepID=A0ABU5DU81_9PROT|nr:methyltransferase domain-containing protein [Dongia rigui]MDY0870870.1 methyltransferase domain-containing protein [Dongia rigui]